MWEELLSQNLMESNHPLKGPLNLVEFNVLNEPFYFGSFIL